MENYLKPPVQTGFDMVEYVDDTHPQFPHFHSNGMPFSTNVLSDDVCITFADNDLQQESEPYDYFLLGRNESKETLRFPTFHDETVGAFKKWNSSSYLKSLPSKRGQSIHKRCIRLLKYIGNHRILGPDSDNRSISMRGDIQINVRHNHDKLAIHHVIAERKRREDMNEIFSTLRGLLPLKTKGRATVLLQTIDYVICLKRRVEELEKRNQELERLALGDHTSQNFSPLDGPQNNSVL